MAAMADYHEELAKAGILLDASGLQPTSKGWRIKFSGDKRKVIDGPFSETKELIAGYTIIQARSKEEALEWTKRFPNPAAMAGKPRSRCANSSSWKTSLPAKQWTAFVRWGGRQEVAAAFEPNQPTRRTTMKFLGLYRPAAPEGTPPSQETMAEDGQADRGDDQGRACCWRPRGACRARTGAGSVRGGKFTVTDGPFTESKELIAGFALFDVKSKEEAIEWSLRFIDVAGEGENELRQIFEAGLPLPTLPAEPAKRSTASRRRQARSSNGRPSRPHGRALHRRVKMV